jgi:hypothetical protein
LNIFDTILKTTITRVELEHSWEAIERDINIQEQLEAKQQPRNQPYLPLLKFDISSFSTPYSLSDA